MVVVALAVLLLEKRPYRWRRLQVGDAPVTSMVLPSKGKRTFVASGLGFAIRDVAEVDAIPMAQVTSVALGDYAPDTVVAVGKANGSGNVRFSLDGGESWRPCPASTTLEGGGVAVSATGRTWVWSGSGGVKRTDDYGFTWLDCDGLTPGSSIVADRTSARQFYAVSEGKIYVSDNGAKSFEQRDLSLPREDMPQTLVPSPGRVGDLWLLAGGHLYHCLPGQTFQRMPGVTDPLALSFGLARGLSVPGPLRLAMFLRARIEGCSGLFRSDNHGATWALLEGAPENAQMLAGDPAHVGRIFVAPQEGGLWIGDPR